MMRQPVWWWLAVLTVIALAVAGVYWASHAIWVKIISDRWNAMCREEEEGRK